MRRIALLFIAAASAAHARPRYGGSLVVEMRAAPRALDPLAAETLDAQRVPMLLFDRMVEIDEAGAAKPGLALSWTSDAGRRRWQFAARPGVRTHDGNPLTVGQIAASLTVSLPGRTVTAAGDSVVVQSARPMPALLEELAHARASIVVRLANGTLQGSGPFRAVEWEPSRKLVAAAFDGYWGGRPFLDSVEIRFGVPLRDQLADFEAGKADAIEATPAEFRRQELRGRRVWAGAMADLIALVHLRGRPAVQDPRTRQALALSVDRGPILSVLLQKQGEAAGSLLPSWLTGYGFVFSSQRDLAKARETGAGQPAVAIGHDPADWVLQSIAERIALNAREAGLPVKLATGAEADAILVRMGATSASAARTLADYCRVLQTQTPEASSPDALYAAERRLLDGYWIVPLFHTPPLWAVQPRVRNWVPAGRVHWRIEEVWLEAAR